MQDKHCPHCQQQIKRDNLKQQNTQKDYINRKPIKCPHCEKLIQLPPLAEKLISIGLLLSVIIAPLNFYWFSQTWTNSQLISSLIFGLGILLIVAGMIKNQPKALNLSED